MQSYSQSTVSLTFVSIIPNQHNLLSQINSISIISHAPKLSSSTLYNVHYNATLFSRIICADIVQVAIYVGLHLH